jgi:hypothetical protein
MAAPFARRSLITGAAAMAAMAGIDAMPIRRALAGTSQPPFFYAPPAMPLVAVLGDSRPHQELNQTVAPSGLVNFVTSPHGSVAWLEPLTQGRVRVPWNYNFAIAGTGTTEILATQIPQLLALSPRPTHAVINTITNDLTGALGVATIKANLLLIWQTIRASKIQPVMMLDLPRTVASWSATNLQQSCELNQWIRDYGPGLGVVVIDPISVLADPNNSNGDPLTGYTYDSIHPVPVASYQIGLLLAAYFNTLPGPSVRRIGSRGGVYNAANNQRGNLISAGMMQGAAGTNTPGAGTATGTVATGWNNRVISGTGVSTASVVARADGGPGNWQQLVLTDSSGGSLFRLSLITPPVPADGYATGDVVHAEVDLVVSAASGLTGCRLDCFDINTGVVIQQNARAFEFVFLVATYWPLPPAYTVRLRTPDFTVTTGSANLIFRVEPQLASGGSATVKVGDAEIRKTIVQ